MDVDRGYDFIFSLGQSCACSQALRVAGLQYASFPFDWIGGPTLREPVRIIANDFKQWMRLEAFMHIGDRLHPQGRIYRNVETELIYSHEVPLDGTMAEVYDSVCTKYARRIRRFKRVLAESKRILAVRLAVPGLPEECKCDLIEAQRSLAGTCNWAKVDLLYIVNRNGVTRVREKKIGSNVVVAELDYAEKGVEDPNPLVPDLEVLEPYLRTFHCRDYRTCKERNDFNGRRDYRTLFAERMPLPPRPNKVWNYGPGAFELTPLTFSETFKDNNRFREEMDAAVKKVLDSGVYLRGGQLVDLEHEFGSYVEAANVIAVASVSELARALKDVDCGSMPVVDFSKVVSRNVGRKVLSARRRVAYCLLDGLSNLESPGNIGCMITSDSMLAARIRAIVQPADELSAAMLRVRLRHIDGDNQRRLDIAIRYKREIKSGFSWPYLGPDIRIRSLVGVNVMVADAKMCCAAIRNLGCGCVVEGANVILPISPSLANEKIGEIINVVNSFRSDDDSSEKQLRS